MQNLNYFENMQNMSRPLYLACGPSRRSTASVGMLGRGAADKFVDVNWATSSEKPDILRPRPVYQYASLYLHQMQ